jgi:tripartite-type tricarboxylate transporter receptor subunit TctC
MMCAFPFPQAALLACAVGAMPLAGVPALANTWPQRPVQAAWWARRPAGRRTFWRACMPMPWARSWAAASWWTTSPAPAARWLPTQRPRRLADGHTLLVTGPASITSRRTCSRLNYDPTADFVPVSMLGAGAFAMVAHPSVPAKQRGRADCAGQGQAGRAGLSARAAAGASGHLCTESVLPGRAPGCCTCPTRAMARPSMNDLLAGQTQLMFTAPNVAMPHVKAGKLRLLA